jgi:hypothetical protein
MIERYSEEWWAGSEGKVRRCKAHRKNGDQCRHAAMNGATVCQTHGGRAPQTKAKARLRLEMASDRLARELLNMTTDPNVADPVKLAAIKDALDRSGIQAKTAVSVEVSTKPFELVFDSISRNRQRFRQITPSRQIPPWVSLRCPPMRAGGVPGGVLALGPKHGG